MTQYGDNKCLDCEHNRKCYMRSKRAYECGVEFVCKKEENKKIEKIETTKSTETEKINVKVSNKQHYDIRDVDKFIIDKINEIIEVINERN